MVVERPRRRLGQQEERQPSSEAPMIRERGGWTTERKIVPEAGTAVRPWGRTTERPRTTGLCPGGRLRMERLLRVLKTKRVDPTAMTSHTFGFDEMERAFDKKLDDVVKVLITF
jgi:threonine dehydrogenase-like Zn-dependent dehydrogenase